LELEYSDNDILKGILLKDDTTLEYIYDKYLPMVKFYICSNNGSEEDARDIFQESVIIIFKKVECDSLVLTSSFQTYLYSICKHIWLKELNKRKIRAEDLVGDDNEFINIPEIEIDEYITDSRKRIFQRNFAKLSQDCQKVLILFMKKFSLREIAEIMGYKSENYAKKRKYQCKETLLERVQSDPLYNDEFDEKISFD
jgi:RNA polymerase sigma factor (sigma-70 family)